MKEYKEWINKNALNLFTSFWVYKGDLYGETDLRDLYNENVSINKKKL